MSLTADVIYREYKTRTMLKKKNYTDSWFLTSNGGSPYRGCEHGCIYCDGRSDRYGLPLFDSEIQVKMNAPDILEKELSRMIPAQKTLFDYGKEKQMTAIFYGGSGTSDWYQPCERKYRLARSMIEKYVKYKIPLHIMTKSDMVLHDLDLLKKLPWCAISFSFCTSDDGIAHRFEPKASIPTKRLEAMRRLSMEDIATGACYMPIIPFISDSWEMIDETIRKVKESGGGYAVPGCMTLRRDKEEFFFGFIERHFPQFALQFKELYMNGYTPKGEYIRELNKKVFFSCKKHEIMPYMPRFLPDTPLKKNREVSTMLHRISFLSEAIEGPSKKSNAFRNAACNVDNLNETIEVLFQEGRLREIKGVGYAIASVIEEYLRHGKSSLLARLGEG